MAACTARMLASSPSHAAAAAAARCRASGRSGVARRAAPSIHRRAVRCDARAADDEKASEEHPSYVIAADGLPRTAKVGILGGGQLGRMLAIAAAPMGVRLLSLDPTPSSPASITAIQTEGKFNDKEDVVNFAKDCDVVTVEIEHIDVEALRELEALGVDVQPTSQTLAIIQDKFAQKEHFQEAGVPLGDFRAVNDAKELADAASDFGFPIMLKSRRMAYDGKEDRPECVVVK